MSFAETFDLRRYIRFRTRVDRLFHSPSDSGRRKWTLRSLNLDDGNEQEEEYDHVAVCNGHYSDPWIPDIPGLSSVPPSVSHFPSLVAISYFQGRNADS